MQKKDFVTLILSTVAVSYTNLTLPTNSKV